MDRVRDDIFKKLDIVVDLEENNGNELMERDLKDTSSWAVNEQSSRGNNERSERNWVQDQLDRSGKMCSSKPQEVSATVRLNSGLEVQAAGFRRTFCRFLIWAH